MAKRIETKANKTRAANKAGRAAPPARVSRAKPAKPAAPIAPDYSALDNIVTAIVRQKGVLAATRSDTVDIIAKMIKGAADINAAANAIVSGRFGDVYVAAYMTDMLGADYTPEQGAAIRAKAGATSQSADRRTAIMEKAMTAMRQEQFQIRKLGGWIAADTRGGANNPTGAAGKRGTKARKEAPAAKPVPVMPAAASIGNSVDLATSLLFHAKACMDLINAKPTLGLNPWVGDVHALINHLKGFLAQNKG